jgi:hypothetical protein
MSKQNNHPVAKRIKQLHIPTFQIAQHVMLSVNDIDDWLDGKKNLSFAHIWSVCELLDVDYNEVIKWEVEND